MSKQTKTFVVPSEYRIAVQRVDAKTTTEGGLVVPDNYQDKEPEGIVLMVGEGLVNNGFYRQGDRVIFGRHAGVEVDLGTGRSGVMLLLEAEIYGKLVEQEVEVND